MKKVITHPELKFVEILPKENPVVRRVNDEPVKKAKKEKDHNIITAICFISMVFAMGYILLCAMVYGAKW